MKKASLLCLLVFFLLPCYQVLAWGLTGHRVVAQIAQDHLTHRANHRIKQLLEGQSLAYWANWPDMLRSDTTNHWKHTFAWHYVNAPKNINQEAFAAYINQTKEENLYSESERLIGILKDKKAPKEQRAEALKFLIHLMGDLHQPFHAGRSEDLGGNKIPVTWFGEQTNIHSVWDSKMIDSKKLSFTEYAWMLDIVSKDQIKIMQTGTVMDWLYESHTLADQLYADIVPYEKLSYGYIYKYDALLDAQLLKAGLRLAKIINESL